MIGGKNSEKPKDLVYFKFLLLIYLSISQVSGSVLLNVKNFPWFESLFESKQNLEKQEFTNLSMISSIHIEGKVEAEDLSQKMPNFAPEVRPVFIVVCL